MIGYLSGTIKFIFDREIILDVHGVGYRVLVDTTDLKIGTEVAFFIHTAVREDAINLYGFKNREEFNLFEKLLTVSGVGAKSAAAIVAKISPAEFAAAVNSQDVKTLAKLPGVGKKTAEKIYFELKDEFKNLPVDSIAQVTISKAIDEATDALSSLGYTSAEISSVLKDAPENFTTEQLIKLALQKLSGFIKGTKD